MASDIFSDISELEKYLQLPEGFYQQLYKEEDWSFLIKLNALIEAACTHALIACLHAPELIDSFANIDLGNAKYGKVIMLRKLNALTSEQAKILQLLYEMRNSVAHNVAKVSFTFKSHLAGLDKQQRSSFIKRIGHGIADSISVGNKSISRDEFVISNPKISLWMTTAEIIACLYLENEIAEIQLQKLAVEKFSTWG